MFDIDKFFTTEIKFLSAEDQADVVCNDCLGCKNCCKELSARITLDCWDMALLKKGLGKTFDELLNEGLIRLIEINCTLLPVFGRKKEFNECIFLGDNGRCSIHPWRAGICRMYPLARLWKGDGSFHYYMQEDECPNRTGETMSVWDWLGYSEVGLENDAYESTISAYHLRLNEYREASLQAKSETELKKIQQDFFDKNFRNFEIL